VCHYYIINLFMDLKKNKDFKRIAQHHIKVARESTLTVLDFKTVLRVF